MKEINVTEFRQHLPQYLKQVGQGEEIILTSRGKILARVVPDRDLSAQARARLASMRGKMIIGDIIETDEMEARWNADEDNL